MFGFFEKLFREIMAKMYFFAQGNKSKFPLLELETTSAMKYISQTQWLLCKGLEINFKPRMFFLYPSSLLQYLACCNFQ